MTSNNRNARGLRLPADAWLWQEAMRDVAPLRHRRGKAASPTKPPPETPRLQVPAIEPRPERAGSPAGPTAGKMRSGAPPVAALVGDVSGIDHANAQRLRRGQWPIEGRLDLHGLSREQAHHALRSFLRRASGDGKRCVLVITGKGGRPEGPGILKSAVPRWLEEAEFRRSLLAVTAARPQHGGGGAFYVLLRRDRGARDSSEPPIRRVSDAGLTRR